MKRILPTLLAMATGSILSAQGVPPAKAPQDPPQEHRGPQEQKKGRKPAVPQVQAPKKSPKIFRVGKAIDPSLSLRTIDGKTIRFKDLLGKVVVVHFWSTRCPFVKVSDPKMVSLAKTFGSKVVFLAIDSNKTELKNKDPKAPAFAELRKVAKRRKLPYPILVDPGNKVADRFQARTTPHCYVIDAKGILRYQGALDNDPRGRKGDRAKNYLKDAIQAVLSGKKVPQAETRAYGCSIKRIQPKKRRRT
ncbi:MAG TPA: redoxin domain-containing protein [Planctomycetes bacterium]|nr:redoxin domain-containing protein [Planctomycetota bacterium]